MSLTILHVEDDPLISDAVAELLTSEGGRVRGLAVSDTPTAMLAYVTNGSILSLEDMSDRPEAA